MDRQRGSMGKGTSAGTESVKRWAKRWRGRCQKRRMASMAKGDEGMNVGNMDPQKEGRAPDQRQQRLGRWGTGTPADAGVAAGQQGEDPWNWPV